MRAVRVLFCHHGDRLVKGVSGQRNVGIVGEQSHKRAGIVYLVIVKYKVPGTARLEAVQTDNVDNMLEFEWRRLNGCCALPVRRGR